MKEFMWDIDTLIPLKLRPDIRLVLDYLILLLQKEQKILLWKTVCVVCRYQ